MVLVTIRIFRDKQSRFKDKPTAEIPEKELVVTHKRITSWREFLKVHYTLHEEFGSYYMNYEVETSTGIKITDNEAEVVSIIKK